MSMQKVARLQSRQYTKKDVHLARGALVGPAIHKKRCSCSRWRACRAGNSQKRCSCSRWRARCPNCSGAQNRYIIKEMLLTFVLISLSGTTQTVFYNYLQPVFQNRNYLLRRHYDKLRFLFRILRKLRFRFWLRLYTIK